MQRTFLAIALAAMASLAAGCAQMHHSTEMGASADTQDKTVCKDGTVLPPNTKCNMHGGVSTQH